MDMRNCSFGKHLLGGAKMSGKWVAAVVLGVALAVAGSSVNWNLRAQEQAQVRGPKPQQWEYKVVWSQSLPNGTSASVMTADYNRLANSGWEYVGPVVNGAYTASPAGAYVLFKRLKE
jgi:hypothetical protein